MMTIGLSLSLVCLRMQKHDEANLFPHITHFIHPVDIIFQTSIDPYAYKYDKVTFCLPIKSESCHKKNYH